MTVVTVKILPPSSADLPSPDFDNAFCNELSAGDGNSRGDDRKGKRVTVAFKDERERVRRFVRAIPRDRVTTRRAETERNLSRFCASLSGIFQETNYRRFSWIFHS